MPEAPQDRPEVAAPDELTEAFATVLDRLGGFADIGAEDADGFLTAVACAPQRLDILQWLPWMCGDAFERCFGDPADAAQARDVLQRWMERIAEALAPRGLDEQPDLLHLRPYLAEWDDAARAEEMAAGLDEDERHLLFTGALWCAGFLRGLEAVGREQQTLMHADTDQAMSATLAHITALLLGDRGAGYDTHVQRYWPGRKVTRDLLIDTALLAVQDLRMIWLEVSLTPAPLLVGHKLGRNDPCHCGSGKKFKKCHGA